MLSIVFLNLIVIASSERLIDLTHPFEDGNTITWPKSPKFNFTIRSNQDSTLTKVDAENSCIGQYLVFSKPFLVS